MKQTSLNSSPSEIQLGNETWFKILAFISFICACVVNAVLVWFLICRQNRIQYTDTELKEHAKKKVKKRKNYDNV